jgi:hypothetical protein
VTKKTLAKAEDRVVRASGLFEPQTYAEAQKLAELLAASDMVPKDFRGKPGNVLIALQLGREIGLQWLQALQNITVINGRPCVWGDALLAIVKASGQMEDFDERYDAGKGGEDEYAAVCMTKRRGEKREVVRRFSVKDAKRAGLWGKDSPWKTHPQRMLQMKARNFCLRDVYPDILKGLTIREVAEEIVEVESSVREPVATARLDLDSLRGSDSPAPAPEATPAAVEQPAAQGPAGGESPAKPAGTFG